MSDAYKSFVLLDSSLHHREGFDCGDDNVNAYLKQRAAKQMSQSIAKTFVLLAPPKVVDEKAIIKCFYAWTMQTIKREQIPEGRRLPPTDIPVLLVSYLGIDLNFQGQGLFDALIYTILIKAARQLRDSDVNFLGLVIDPMSEALEKTYIKRGFRPLLDNNPESNRKYSRLIYTQKQLDILLNDFDQDAE